MTHDNWKEDFTLPPHYFPPFRHPCFISSTPEQWPVNTVQKNSRMLLMYLYRSGLQIWCRDPDGFINVSFIHWPANKVQRSGDAVKMSVIYWQTDTA